MAEIASAFVSILPSTKGFGSKLNSEVGGSVRSSGTSLGRTFGKMFAAGAGIIAAAGIGKLLTGSIDEAREAQKVGAQTAAVLKSTGGAAGLTADQVGKMATRLSGFTGIDDEAIQSAENLLLTFTNVRNEVGGQFTGTFDSATQTIVDMSVALGTDMKSATVQVGKALNDPIKGITALSRVGVSFTEQQKEQIKTLVDSGKTTEAQRLILKELTKEFGGSAEAQATAGDKARVAIGNLKEQIGTALLPVVDKLANLITTRVVPAVSTFITQLQSGEGAGGKVAAVFAAVADIIGTFVGQMKSGEGAGGAFVSVLTTIASALGTLFQWINQNRTVTAVFIGTIVAITVATAAFNAVLAANPIGLVVIAIAALAAGLVYAYKHSETFRNAVNALWKGTKAAFQGIQKAVAVAISFIAAHWRTIIVILGGPIGLAVALITKHWDKIKAGAQIVIGWVKSNWPAIKEVIVKPFETAKTVIGKVWSALKQGASRVKDVIVGYFNSIKGAIDAVVGAIKSAIDWLGKLASKLSHLPHPHIPGFGRASAGKGGGLAGQIVGGTKDDIAAAYGILTRVTDAAAKKADEHGKKLKEKIGKIRDALSQARSDFASLVEPIASNFTQGLFEFDTASAFTANLQTVKGTLNTLLANFTKLKGEGLSSSFLYQLFQSGGPGLINSLAALDKGAAQDAANTFGQVMSLSDQLGTAVAGATDKGAALEKQTARLEKKLDQLIHHVDRIGGDVGREVNSAASGGHRRGKNGGRRAA